MIRSSWVVLGLVIASSSWAGAQTQPAAAGDSSGRTEGFILYGYNDPAYKLPPGPHLFVDYRYIDSGQTKYVFPDGSEAPRYGGDVSRLPSVRAIPQQPASNIRIEAQKAEKLGVIIDGDQPWEFMLGYPTLMRDPAMQGKYRLWYELAAEDGDRARDLMCYAESDDGLKWTKPKLGLIEFGGNKDNNIVYSAAFAGQITFHGAGVFVDPMAPPEQRYKMIYMSKGLPEEIAAFKSAHPLSVSPKGEQKETFIRLAGSPDGIHWKPIPQPLMIHQSDTLTTVYYDEVLKRYVGFFRHYFMDRRTIGRAESTDLAHPWPIPKVTLYPHPMHDEAGDDYYISGYCRYPRTSTMHLMVATVFKRHADTTQLSLASSLDGEHWDWLPGGPVLQPGVDGSWDGGCIFAGINLTELPDGRVVFPYDGYAYPHKFPRYGQHVGKIGLAGWQSERLAAVIADGVGEFTTRPLSSQGTQLFLNFQTKHNGYVKVSIEAAGNQPVPTRTADLGDPLFGDQLKKRVTWKGESDIAIKPGETFMLHFQLREAKLYSFELR